MPKIKENDINCIVTFFLAIQIAVENLELTIEKGVIKHQVKAAARNFINFWQFRTGEFWRIFNSKDIPDCETVELIQGLENMEQIIPMFSKLKTEEVHVIKDFMAKMLAGDFTTENTVYDFGKVFVEFKATTIYDSLKENLVNAIEADFYSLFYQEFFVQPVIEEGKIVDIHVMSLNCKILADRNNFHDWNLQDILEVNNILYDRYKQRTFKPTHYCIKNNVHYTFLNVHDSIADYTKHNIEWRAVVTGETPTYGKSEVHFDFKTTKRGFFVVNREIIFLDQLNLIENDN